MRLYELDVTSRVGTAVYFDWLQEATFWAANVVGWPLERMKDEDFITLQYRHDAEFFEVATQGDEIEIVSRLISVKPIRGTWVHEVFRPVTKTLLMRDYSTGAFLDWKGKIKPAPTVMMEALVRGEPGDTNRKVLTCYAQATGPSRTAVRGEVGEGGLGRRSRRMLFALRILRSLSVMRSPSPLAETTDAPQVSYQTPTNSVRPARSSR